MRDLEFLLNEAAQKHGHLCASQVIGVRMAMLGCRLVGIDNPKDPRYEKKLIVYVEIDRCAADAISSVTGCQLGKRTMKFYDFGINAATFVNLTTYMSYRIISTESSKGYVSEYAPHDLPVKERQIIGYQQMPDALLFNVQRVQISLPQAENSGRPRQHVICQRCGQIIRDGKEVYLPQEVICRACSSDSYFKVLEPRFSPDIKSDLYEEKTF